MLEMIFVGTMSVFFGSMLALTVVLAIGFNPRVMKWIMKKSIKLSNEIIEDMTKIEKSNEI